MSDIIIRVDNLSKQYVLGQNGKSEGLRHAEEEGLNAVVNLRAVAAIRGLATERSEGALKLAGSIERFLVDARDTYGIMLSSSGNVSQETQEQMRRLASQTDVLKASLKRTKDQFSSDMHGQLGAVQARSSRQRWVAFLVF